GGAGGRGRRGARPGEQERVRAWGGGRGRLSAPGPSAPPREFGFEEDDSGSGKSRRRKAQDRPAGREPADAEDLDGRRSRGRRSGAGTGRRRGRFVLLAVGLVVVLAAGAAGPGELSSPYSGRGPQPTAPSPLRPHRRPPPPR